MTERLGFPTIEMKMKRLEDITRLQYLHDASVNELVDELVKRDECIEELNCREVREYNLLFDGPARIIVVQGVD